MFSKFLTLIFSIAISLSAGLIGSIFTLESIPTWYEGLNKPFFNPPNWIFAPVWTVLYLLIGISLYLVIETSSNSKKTAYLAFTLQLILNTLWSIVFFGFKSPFAAFIIIILLIAVITFNIRKFYRINKLSGLILLPYLVWVIFASFLNFFIMLYN